MAVVFDYHDYKQYLKEREQNWPGRGLRVKLAQALRCQPSYISSVLNDDAHLSLEQGALGHELLGHTESEAHFFMLLLQMARAGNQTLKDYFNKQVQTIKEERTFLQSRINQKSKISKTDQMLYYSTHIHSLIHVALSIPGLQTAEKIAQRFQMPLDVIHSSLEFLLKIGLASHEKGTYKISPTHMHLDRNSPMVNRHHANMRVKALENLDLSSKQDFHYSAAMAFSERDWPLIRKTLVEALGNLLKVVERSPEEDVYIFNADLFKVKK